MDYNYGKEPTAVVKILLGVIAVLIVIAVVAVIV